MLVLCVAAALLCGCEDGNAPASWAYKYAATVEDAYDFINGFPPHVMPRAAACVVAADAGFYVFYRDDLVGTSDWHWQMSLSSSGTVAFLNGEDSACRGPVEEAMVAYRTSGEMYVFSRGMDPDAAWKHQPSADTADTLGFLNGAGDCWMPGNGVVCGNAANEMVTFFRDDKLGGPGWQTQVAMSPDEAADVLNGVEGRGTPAAEAKIFAASDGSFVVYYRVGSGD